MDNGSLPLWLSIAALVLAPLLGLLGVIYGARRSERTQRLQWRDDRRLDIYSEWIAKATDCMGFATTRLGGAMMSGNPVARAEKIAELSDRLHELNAIRSRLRLVATPHVAALAGEVFGLLTQMQVSAIGLTKDATPLFEKDAFAEHVKKLLDAEQNFTNAARREFDRR